MRGAVILAVVALLVGYLAVSGKYCCLTQLGACIATSNAKPCECQGGEVASASAGQNRQQSFAELLRPLEVPGVTTAPYNFNLFG